MLKTVFFIYAMFALALVLALFVFSIIITEPAVAGGVPGTVGYQAAGTRVGVNNNNYAGSSAGATNAGNSQNINFSGSPSRQAIETTPGLGAQFIPSAGYPCYPGWGAQAVTTGVGAGMTASTLSYPCHTQEMAKTQASIGVAAFNAGLVDQGRAEIINALDLIACSNRDTYLLRKAKRQPCPIRPDYDLRDELLGGPARQTVEIVSGYSPPQITMSNPPESEKTDYVDRSELNRKLDQVMNKAMVK